MENNIICAVSTPPGIGGIAVIRLSGKGSIELADSVFIASGNKKLINQPDRKSTRLNSSH